MREKLAISDRTAKAEAQLKVNIQSQDLQSPIRLFVIY